MALPTFNQSTVDAKINEVKNLPQPERDAISAEISGNIQTWLNANFEISSKYNSCMNNWPVSVRDEVSFVVGLAVKDNDWKIVVVFPTGNPQERCGHFEDSVSTSYNLNTGQTVITKTLKWQWD